MFDAGRIPFVRQSLWHRIKRRLFATPTLHLCAALDVGDGLPTVQYVLLYEWPDDTYEVVKCGVARPGEPIAVPPNCRSVWAR